MVDKLQVTETDDEGYPHLIMNIAPSRLGLSRVERVAIVSQVKAFVICASNPLTGVDLSV